MNLIIHTDGGARGNPGPAAVGFTIDQENKTSGKPVTIHEFGKTIGKATNNVAEYKAVIAALKYLREQGKKIFPDNGEIKFRLDSVLVVNQLNGLFKIKDPTLRQLLTEIRILETEIGGTITYSYIPREQNRQADILVNQVLDREMYRI